ncbi:MAG TPA: sulfotransferase domain-containing protein [Pirellulales bacterium]|nr:sulfotransferase domain-containing protein [Pirellulales bacterium]
MIVWLSSYPRSGNTFLRIVIHKLYGVPTYSIYEDDDPVAQRVGPELVGYCAKPADRSIMIDGADVYFTKTHKRWKADGYRAIYLVRDGRDVVVSNARLRALSHQATVDDRQTLFETLLREEITRPYTEGQPSSGTWGGNVLSWLGGTNAPLAVLRYEDLIVDPLGSVERAVSSFLPELVPLADASVPSFDDLHRVDPFFFRRGIAGAHHDEMSDELLELFWAQPENASAMRQLGYDG